MPRGHYPRKRTRKATAMTASPMQHDESTHASTKPFGSSRAVAVSDSVYAQVKQAADTIGVTMLDVSDMAIKHFFRHVQIARRK